MYKYLHICACTYLSIGFPRPSLLLIARKCSYPLNLKVIEFSISLPLLRSEHGYQREIHKFGSQK